jgi:hypothetical protein
MQTAIPVYNGRVSPVFDTAQLKVNAGLCCVNSTRGKRRDRDSRVTSPLSLEIRMWQRLWWSTDEQSDLPRGGDWRCLEVMEQVQWVKGQEQGEAWDKDAAEWAVRMLPGWGASVYAPTVVTRSFMQQVDRATRYLAPTAVQR